MALGDSLTVEETGFPTYDESASYREYLEALAKQHLAGLQSGVELNVVLLALMKTDSSSSFQIET